MAISKCPRCDEKVTIPVGGRPENRVRCPMCQEEYSLGEAMEAMPPALILLDAPTPVAMHAAYAPAPAYADYGAYGSPASDLAEASSEPTFGESDDLALQSLGEEEGGLGLAEAPAAPAAPRSKTKTKTSKPRKAKKSPLMEGVKVVGGGALGIAIAIMVLWWLPDMIRPGKYNRDNRDPFKLGPKVAQYAPFLVPENLREPPAPPVKKTNTPKTVANKTPSNVKKAGNEMVPGADQDAFSLGAGDNLTIPPGEGIGNLGFDLNSPVTGDEPAPKKPASKKPAAKKPTTEPANEPDPFDLGAPPATPVPSPTPVDEPAPADVKPAEVKPVDAKQPIDAKPSDSPFDEPAPDKAASEKPMKPATPTEEPKKEKPEPPAPAQVGLRFVPDVTDDLVPQTLAAFENDNKAWLSADPTNREEQKMSAVNLYSGLAKVAETATHLQASGMLTGEHISDIVARVRPVIAVEKTGKTLGRYAGLWLDDSARTNAGAVLIGVVKDVTPMGKLFSLQLEIPAKEPRVVRVLSATDPAASLKAGDKAVVLGVVVENPREALHAYEGPAHPVVYQGVAFSFEAAE